VFFGRAKKEKIKGIEKKNTCKGKNAKGDKRIKIGKRWIAVFGKREKAKGRKTEETKGDPQEGEDTLCRGFRKGRKHQGWKKIRKNKSIGPSEGKGGGASGKGNQKCVVSVLEKGEGNGNPSHRKTNKA